MSASLEIYLVKLYLDRDARRTFVAALERVERDGLEVAARSFARKREGQRPRGLWARLRRPGSP